MKQQTTKSVLSILKELDLNKSCSFPIERAPYVRATCSNFGVFWDKHFTTKINKENRTIEVTRDK